MIINKKLLRVKYPISQQESIDHLLCFRLILTQIKQYQAPAHFTELQGLPAFWEYK